MRKFDRKVIISSPKFDYMSGGNVCLHYLGSLIEKLNIDVYICTGKPKSKPTMNRDPVFNIKYISQSEAVEMIAKTDGVIAIYPETARGNPLQAKHVVRWLLHKNIYHFSETPVKWLPTDLIATYDNATPVGLPMVNYTSTDLTIRYHLIDTYRNCNLSSRKGTCFINRKNNFDTPVLNIKSDTKIDDIKNHQQIAKTFNEHEKFISYDPYTLFSTYAAIAGCDSIVAPIPGVTKEEWHPDERDRYGIAYGDSESEIKLARETRSLIPGYIQDQNDSSLNIVRDFINYTLGYYRL
jgi:hypothetical protein